MPHRTVSEPKVVEGKPVIDQQVPNLSENVISYLSNDNVDLFLPDSTDFCEKTLVQTIMKFSL